MWGSRIVTHEKLTDNEDKLTYEASDVSMTNEQEHRGLALMVSSSHLLLTVDGEQHPEAMLDVAEDLTGWHIQASIAVSKGSVKNLKVLRQAGNNT